MGKTPVMTDFQNAVFEAQVVLMEGRRHEGSWLANLKWNYLSIPWAYLVFQLALGYGYLYDLRDRLDDLRERVVIRNKSLERIRH
jgi:hypothetical protein